MLITNAVYCALTNNAWQYMFMCRQKQGEEGAEWKNASST